LKINKFSHEFNGHQTQLYNLNEFYLLSQEVEYSWMSSNATSPTWDLPTEAWNTTYWLFSLIDLRKDYVKL